MVLVSGSRTRWQSLLILMYDSKVDFLLIFGIIKPEARNMKAKNMIINVVKLFETQHNDGVLNPRNRDNAGL